MVVVAAAVGGILVILAAALLVGTSRGHRAGAAPDHYTVVRGTFDISVPASGELAALNQIEIRNRFDYRAVITEIVKEGSAVRKGDLLFRLNDQEVRNKIKDAEDTLNNAQSALVTAQAKLDIQLSAEQSALAKADLDVTLAELALKAWTEGEDVSRQNELELELATAAANCERLVARYEESRKLVERQFISQDEFKRDEIAKIEAEARLKQARLDERIYREYLREQDQANKRSDVEQAVAERDRVRERFKAELETARAEVASKEHNLRSAQERLLDLQEQAEFCAVTAPADGWVVYASSIQSGRSWRNEGQPPTVGTELPRNELVIVLPDTSQMIAAVKVNEALSGLIQPGQHATIGSEAMPDVVMHGEVVSIGVLAESGGWIDRNRRDYTVKIRIDDANELPLKPSMRCKADIFVNRVQDTLYVPVQAVFREGSTSFVYVPEGSGYAQREIRVGRASEVYVEVVGGLAEQEVVLLRQPEPQEIVTRLAMRDDNGGDRSAMAPPDGRPLFARH
jgi:HlyD family secretion protein